jgi:hypothetical protein
MQADNLTKADKAKLIIDFFHRTMMHHAIWFAEVQEKMGREMAFKTMDKAWQKSYGIQMKRLGKILGFESEDGVPDPIMGLPEEKLDELMEGAAINWLANDGVWFQAVEFEHGMAEAKHCNDNAWRQFSPLEAWSIKRMLDLPEQAGLEGLKKALKFRLYAYINKQSFAEETENSFVFRMNECRVQLARKRKGLEDYPCKSGGMVEYTSFAEAIDSRIRTECISCPPDPHPEEYFCAWKFYIEI